MLAADVKAADGGLNGGVIQYRRDGCVGVGGVDYEEGFGWRGRGRGGEGIVRVEC